MVQKRTTYLYHRYRSGTLSADEQKEWSSLWADESDIQSIKDLMDADWEAVKDADLLPVNQQRTDLHLRQVMLFPQQKPVRRLWWRVAAVAALLTLFSIAALLLYSNNEVVPGGNYATLTLSDGTQYELSDTQMGIVMEDNGITYIDGSTLTGASPLLEDTTELLTLQTPRGGQYRIKLADGSIVWLNADTKIRYASSFSSASKREVHLDGEAYFEVIRDETRPFVVYVGNQRIEVLGTRFVVSAYPDVPAQTTTLVSGSVRVEAGARSITLTPNQQAIWRAAGLSMQDVNAYDQLDWTRGEFVFGDADLASIMRRLGRWYDIQFVFDDLGLQTEQYVGVLDRFDDIDRVLSKLEAIGPASFMRKGRTIYINRK